MEAQYYVTFFISHFYITWYSHGTVWCTFIWPPSAQVVHNYQIFCCLMLGICLHFVFTLFHRNIAQPAPSCGTEGLVKYSPCFTARSGLVQSWNVFNNRRCQFVYTIKWPTNHIYRFVSENNHPPILSVYLYVKAMTTNRIHLIVHINKEPPILSVYLYVKAMTTNRIHLIVHINKEPPILSA